MSWAYLYTFLQTVALEIPFYFIILRKQASPGRLAASVFCLDAISHPIVFFVLMTLKFTLLTDILLAELFAFAFEAWGCWYFLRARPARAAFASFIANFVSWQVGPMLTQRLF